MALGDASNPRWPRETTERPKPPGPGSGGRPCRRPAEYVVNQWRRGPAARLGTGVDRRGCRRMDSMSFALRLSRVALFGVALVLGSLGIFCLYGSCIGAPLAADAIVCLG